MEKKIILFILLIVVLLSLLQCSFMYLFITLGFSLFCNCCTMGLEGLKCHMCCKSGIHSIFDNKADLTWLVHST